MALQSHSFSSMVKLDDSRAAIRQLSIHVKHETPLNLASVGIGGLCGYQNPQSPDSSFFSTTSTSRVIEAFLGFGL